MGIRFQDGPLFLLLVIEVGALLRISFTIPESSLSFLWVLEGLFQLVLQLRKSCSFDHKAFIMTRVHWVVICVLLVVVCFFFYREQISSLRILVYLNILFVKVGPFSSFWFRHLKAIIDMSEVFRFCFLNRFNLRSLFLRVLILLILLCHFVKIVIFHVGTTV